MTDKKTVSLIGAGSWGTALANLLGEKGYEVRMWVFEEELVKDIQEKRENTIYLPGVKLSANIIPSNNLSEVVSASEDIIFATPSHVLHIIADKAK